MKKNLFLGSLTVTILAVSSLVHAAAEPQKTAGCAGIAHSILGRSFKQFPRATSTHIQQNPNHENDRHCECTFPFRTWPVRAKLVEEQSTIDNDRNQLEQCIQQSPTEAQNTTVIEALNTLKTRNIINQGEFAHLDQCHNKSREFMGKVTVVLWLLSI